MYNIELKYEVQQLRVNGYGIREIAKLLNIKPTTVSYWCRDITLSEELIEKIKNNGKQRSKEGLLRYGEKIRNERKQRTLYQKKLGADMVGFITERDRLMIGLGLYWGEGYKESNGEFGFTNSNPSMITFYLEWLNQLHVQKDDLIFKLTINNAYKQYENEIRMFWIKKLNISESQFSKTTYIKTDLKKYFEINMKKYHGILRVKVRRGLSLKNQILGGIDSLVKN